MTGALFLSTGAALLVYVVSGVSLPAAVGMVLAGSVPVGAVVWRRSTPRDRAALVRAVRVGMVAGALATAAYDASRFLMIEITGIAFWPFDIFTVFGQGLLGEGTRGPLVTLAGAAYHAANGTGFGTAYTVWLGHRGVWTGILWAMVLEVLMVSVYPGWLGLRALDEFLQVSVFGHLVYGSVLGWTARALLRRNGAAEHG